MILCPAQPFDIPQIMQVERASFIPGIQEKQKTFDARLQIFPQGFFVAVDTSEKTVAKAGHAVTAGYFCSELWESVPSEDKAFALNHKIHKTHAKGGTVLYPSSYALLPDYRGKGMGKALFVSSLAALCGAFSQIQKIVLLVNTEWKEALHIYETLGFTELRRITGFFPSLHKREKNDALVMTADASLFRADGLLRHNENGSVVIGTGV